jgi:hypothetical protein
MPHGHGAWLCWRQPSDPYQRHAEADHCRDDGAPRPSRGGCHTHRTEGLGTCTAVDTIWCCVALPLSRGALCRVTAGQRPVGWCSLPQRLLRPPIDFLYIGLQPRCRASADLMRRGWIGLGSRLRATGRAPGHCGKGLPIQIPRIGPGSLRPRLSETDIVKPVARHRRRHANRWS